MMNVLRAKVWAMGVGAALLLAAGAAQAQISSKGGPIDISADASEANDAQHVVTYKGKVELLQDQNRLRADSLNIYFAPKAGGGQASGGAPGSNWGGVDRMEATGNVYFVTPTQTVRGDRAVYTAASDSIVVTGNVVIAQGENVMKGERLTVQVATGRATMDGSADQGGRVRGVFYPNTRKPAAGAGK